MLWCAAGAELDATKVLDALSEDMPLSVAVDIIARMLRTAMHARRSGLVVRNLHRSLHLSTAAERAEVRAMFTAACRDKSCSQVAARLNMCDCIHLPRRQAGDI